MPACLAASMMVVPLGTLTGAPSMVTFTSSSVIRLHRRHCRLARALNVGLELVTELLNSAHDRGGAGVAQHADGFASHVVGEIEQQLEVFLLPLPRQDSLQDPHRPGRTLAALSALGAGFVGI